MLVRRQCARHFAAKECGLKLIHGTEVRVEKEKLVLLATDRCSYGAISALITAGRRRSPKGSYALAREDLEAVAHSNALLLWVPGESDGSWIAERFRGRAWIACLLYTSPSPRD